ncbi:Proteasome subunit alpha type-4 [Coemansia sp. RSA 451]|nr:Proteasome subunit alpha type-4 [Coemansia sp. RSA 451]
MRKIHQLDQHIFIASAGLVADARVLVDMARVECQNHRLTIEDPPTVEFITHYVASIQQRYTQSGGRRPFGISTLIVGFDPDGSPRLFQTDPSGIYYQWKANSIGRNSQTVREYLEKHYAENIGEADAVKLAVKSLLEVVQTGAKNIDILVITKDGSRTPNVDEIEGVIKVIEAEKAEEAEKKAARRTTSSLIRYVGTLNDVNEAEETISLKQVRSMGTEGRRGNPAEEIPASNDIYEFIQFRATDVKSVEFENDMTHAPPPPQIPNDPAILEVRAQPQDLAPAPPAYQPAAVPSEPSQGFVPAQVRPAPVPAVHQAAEGDVGAENTFGQQGNQRHQGGYAPRGGYTPRGRGGYNNRGNGPRRGNYQGRGGYQNRRVEVPESDFDFESSNSKLNKDDLAREFAKLNVHVASNDEAVTSERVASTSVADDSGYQPKASFFDNISCETKERIEMQEQGMSHEERRTRVHAERQQNYETFGQAAAEQNRLRHNRYNAGGRGNYQNNNNWRGGRGGRGYHRGGFNPNYRGNNNNNNGNYRNQGGRGYYQGQSQGDAAGEPSVTA